MSSLLPVVLVPMLYGATPVLLVWGWVRWMRRAEDRDGSAVLSFAGFLFATLSALLAAGTVAYAQSFGGFPYYDPRLMKIDLGGIALSIVAVTLSALGTARANLLRWQALGSSCGMFFDE